MGRVTRAFAVLPALIPGACVLLLAFQAGGFFPSSWAPVAALAAIALAVRVSTGGRPFAGFSAFSAIAAGSLALLGAWTLLSASWSDAPGRAITEFGRLLAYGLLLVVCASLAPTRDRLAWALRGLALAIGVVCVAALVSRLRPDLLSATGLAANRLDYPITYWNGLGLLAGVGVLLGLHLCASEREPWPVRVISAALPPIAACTLYFTLSRGAIGVTAAGVLVYLLLGFSRATPAALLVLAPACAVALLRAYDADLLVTAEYDEPAGRAQGRDVAAVVVATAAIAVWLRAVALLVDKLVAGVPGPGRLPRAVRIGAPLAAVGAAIVTAVALGAPGWVERQADAFLTAAPAPTPADFRDRLGQFNSNGRVAHWDVALDAWREQPLRGTGAGTYQNTWNAGRPIPGQVLDAHSLYLEVLSELGVVGLALLLLAIGAIAAGLLWRLRGPDRPGAAAAFAATLAWAVHAGVDWDWELAAVTVWVFGVAGVALAPAAVREGTHAFPRPLRLVVALGCLGLALAPAALWRSQVRLVDAVRAFEAGDCPATIDAALDSLGALRARAEPWELIAYCDVRLGQRELALGAAEAAVRRDPANWEYRYALALVRGAFREDPRPAAAEALRLNPLQPEAQEAVRAFRTDRPELWERRARRLKLYFG